MTQGTTDIEAVDNVLREFLKTHSGFRDFDFSEAERSILKETYLLYEVHNLVCKKDEKWTKPRGIKVSQVVRLLMQVYHVRSVDMVSNYDDGGSHSSCSDGESSGKRKKKSMHMVLCAYDESEGIYYTDPRLFCYEMEMICSNFSEKDKQDVLRKLGDLAPVVLCTQDPNLIPVNNGIFDYRNKMLLPFSPDYVFLSKCPVDFVPNAGNPVIHNDDDGTDWDVETWMGELSDDPEVVELLWQVTGACIRPGVNWDKAAWLYSTQGNNGKGTLCSLMRNLCGPDNCTSIPMDSFDGNQFALGSMVGKSAIITDENSVGSYIDKSGNLKSAITHDILTVERKYEHSFDYRFRGFVVQCLNEFPRVKDKSGSFARRQLLIPFTKCFTGQERKYIKHDYLKRKEVLEYVLCRILSSSYYELSQPDACKLLQEEYNVANSPVYDFCFQVLCNLKWDLVPFTFMYDLYKAWFRENIPSGTLQSSRSFSNELIDVLDTHDFGFRCEDKRKRYRAAGKMDCAEPMILDYKLSEWMNPNYNGKDPDKVCRVAYKEFYNGIVRN